MAYNSKFTGAQIDALLDASEAMKTSKEDAANKVTSLDNPSDVTYPTSKAVWDWVYDINVKGEKTVVSTYTLKNGGAANGSNGYKVRTLALDIRDKSKIILTTDRPLTGNSHYVFEIGLINEETAIGQFVASNENPNGYTLRFIGNLLEGDIVDCSGYAALVVAVYEIPNDGKEGDIVLRKADFSNYRIGYSTNTANSELPTIFNSIEDIKGRIKEIRNNVSASNIYNGGANNTSNRYKVRTEGLDVRGKEYISITTDKPLTGDSYYEFECIFAQDEAAIGKSFGGNQNPNGYTLLSYRPTNILIDSIIKVPSGASAVVVALCEIPNSGKEGDIVLRTTSFSGYSIGYNYGSIYKEIITTQDRVTTIENSIEDIKGRIKDAYQRNVHKSIALGAACRQRKSSNTSKDFQIIEITDSHNNNTAVSNAIVMANGFKTVDAVIHCGDMAGDFITPVSSMDAFINTMKNSTKPWYNIIGNHEAGTYNAVGFVPSIQYMYNLLIAPMVDAGHLVDGEYQVGKCHYYHDFNEYKIRLICVNEYDGDLALDTEYWEAVAYDSSATQFAFGTQYNVGDVVKMQYYTEYCFRCVKSALAGSSIYRLSGQEPKYKAIPGSRMISQEQAQWFLNTMLDTPEGYSIIVAMHNPFSDKAVVDTTKKFSQKTSIATSSSMQNLMENDFFADVVNAYVNGTTYADYIAFKNSASYRNTLINSEGKPYAYYLSADFSAKASNTKFLCFIGGHVHRDFVWNHSTYKYQWQVTPVCAATAYHQSPSSDIRRSNDDGLDYDSVTSISFNATNQAISLVKIGADITENMEYRDFEKIELK